MGEKIDGERGWEEGKGNERQKDGKAGARGKG